MELIQWYILYIFQRSFTILRFMFYHMHFYIKLFIGIHLFHFSSTILKSLKIQMFVELENELSI